jgi:hypothetical protein
MEGLFIPKPASYQELGDSYQADLRRQERETSAKLRGLEMESRKERKESACIGASMARGAGAL